MHARSNALSTCHRTHPHAGILIPPHLATLAVGHPHGAVLRASVELLGVDVELQRRDQRLVALEYRQKLDVFRKVAEASTAAAATTSTWLN